MQNKALQTIRLMLLFGGTIELLIAIFHVTWSFEIVQMPDFVNLQKHVKDFVMHGTVAVGLCMFIFSFLSLYFSSDKRNSTSYALVFSITQMVIWLVRTITELLLPVKIPLYMLENPSPFVLVGVPLLFVNYTIAAYLINKIKTHE